MAYASMTMKGARPCRAPCSRVARGFVVMPRIAPRQLRVYQRAQVPKDGQQQPELQKRRSEGNCADRRNAEFEDYLNRMQCELGAVFSMYGSPGGMRRWSQRRARPFGKAPFPARSRGYCDVEEDEKEYRVVADVPGFSKGDMKITLDIDGMLIIEGAVAREECIEGKAPNDSSGRSSRVREFVQSLQLPDNVDSNSIAATVENGVLTVTIPKLAKETVPTKEIPIS